MIYEDTRRNKSFSVIRNILTTNKTNYTVTTYLPINNKLTNYNNKEPTKNSTHHSLFRIFLSFFFGSVFHG